MSGNRLLSVERFLMTDLISLLLISLFRFSFSSWFTLRWLYVSRIASIYFSLSNVFIAYWVLCIYAIVMYLYDLYAYNCNVFFFFQFWVYLFDWVLSLFWVSLKGFWHFDIFREPDLSSIDLFYYLFTLYLFYFCSVFSHFLLYTDFGLCLFIFS